MSLLVESDPINQEKLHQKDLPLDHESAKIRQAGILELKEKGFDKNQIATITGYSPNSIDAIASRARKKNNTFELLRPSAIKTLKKFIKGEIVGDVKPAGSDVTKSVSMVLDRTDPVVQHTQSDIQVTVNWDCVQPVVDNSVGLVSNQPIIEISQ